MTVAELIEILKGMPQDLPVTTWNFWLNKYDAVRVMQHGVRVTDGVWAGWDDDSDPPEQPQRGPHVRIG